jgi:hypothetical protein
MWSCPTGITSSIAGKRQKKGKAVVETTAEEAAFDPRPNAADVTNGEYLSLKTFLVCFSDRSHLNVVQQHDVAVDSRFNYRFT